jgi:biotin transport system substrate-specific component
MSTTSMSTATLADSIWPQDDKTSAQRLMRGAFLAVIGSLLIAVSSKIQVPFYPVPMTLQTLVILSIGMAYGPRLGMATIILYLVEGAAGLPVFAGTPEKGIGIAYMMGSTGGYLFGFVVAVALCGFGASRGWDRNVWKTASVMFVATSMIFVFGVLWLGALHGWDKPILAWGLYPFVWGGLAKIALAAVSLPLIWKAVSRAK